MTVYLVRHGAAGSRHEWHQPDDVRPLTAKGDRQARALVDVMGAEEIKRIVSSPSIRCRQTVAPLAEHLGLEVELDSALLEGARLSESTTLLRSVAADDVVLCSHGDVIPDLVRWLIGQGMVVDGDGGGAKGSTWVLDVTDGEFVRARYVPPGG